MNQNRCTKLKENGKTPKIHRRRSKKRNIRFDS